MGKRFRHSFIVFAAAVLIAVSLLVSCSTTAIKAKAFKSWDIHTEAQAAYLAAEDYTKPHLFGAKGADELSKPVSPVFEWKYAGSVNTADIASSWLLISENADMADARKYDVPAGDLSFTVADGAMNLKTGTAYYWQVGAQMKDGTEIASDVRTFVTSEGIRNVSVDGVSNFRDLGGKKTMDGGTVRQGLLYRSGRYNRKFEKSLMISDLGLEQIRELGIKTDIDLRGDKDTVNGVSVYANGYPADGSETMVSPLGEEVNYAFIGRIWDNSLLASPAGASMMREVFDILCDESNYPVVFHCSIGTDRTGAVAFLIDCALGLSDEDITRDYLYSNFGNIGSPRLLANFQQATSTVRKVYEGSTYAEQGVKYLLEKGITQEQIDKVRSILIEY